MTKYWIIALVAAVVLLVVVLILRSAGSIAGGLMSGALYPTAPAMPPVVSESADSLLARYEKLLAQQAPAVLSALQPGLSDEQITALETKYGTTLTPDLRSLYRWHNGSQRSPVTHVFPNHMFPPLEDVFDARAIMQKDVKNATGLQRQAFNAFAGHRAAWLDILPDGAGDGYSYDPGRTEAQGSFFFCFAEDGSYDFYPAFRNYLAETLAGFETGVYRFGKLGAETADFAKAQTLGRKYSAAPAR
jgi:cell wall assembly regulator SMI1